VPIQGPGVPIGSIITKCTQPGTFALTYDDGPFDFTTTVLDQLDAAGIKATFFVNGNNVGNINTYAAVIQRMDAGGHQVGSHTFSHADLVTLGDSDVILEMTRLETDLINIMGKYGTYMRPPFFSTNPATLNTLGLLGYHVVQADIDTLDFANKEPVGNLTGATNFQTGIAGGGTIALAHDIHQNTAQVLTPEFIRSITASGLRGVTVGDCLGDPPANWYNGTRTSTPVGTQPASTISITSTSTPTGILTTDTTCGGASGFVCAPGDCCSQFGFCGTSAQHCGTGCNPLFGVCGAFVPVDPNAPPPPPVQTGGISPDSSCGGANAFTCPAGNCCSQFGFCGTTAEHCGTGCQAPFGQCGTPAAPAVSSAVPAAPAAPAA
jgi:peptidoglycan/xylan/chitin deacetylase (PgdA/CDA1 family)